MVNIAQMKVILGTKCNRPTIGGWEALNRQRIVMVHIR